MKIKIAGLENGKHTYDFENKISSLDLEEPFTGNYRTEVVLNKYDDQIILEATTRIKANFVCDRCGKDYSSTVISRYKMVYLLRHNLYDDDSLDVIYISPETDKIIIDADVRDYAILSIPMKKLCSVDCKGLCYKCGKDLNEGECGCETEETDVRFKPLTELKNKLNPN